MAKSSYYASGGGAAATPTRNFEHAVDKDRFYRTNKIFEGAYKKSIKLEEGKVNQTDCSTTVWIKFIDPIDQIIADDLGPSGARHRYLLACGHPVEGKYESIKRVGDLLPCNLCGADQGYLGFEHEWQHIIFKTDPRMTKVFIGPWAAELRKAAPYVDPTQLEQFLFHVINAFDDIRCNSLWELLYAGSSDRIWDRWKRISTARGADVNSSNFIAFLFAVALGTPTDPRGPFEEMRPDVEWGMHHVRYKGYAKALTIARVAMERCLGKMLAKMQPPPPSQGDNHAQGQEDVRADGSERDGAPAPGDAGRLDDGDAPQGAGAPDGGRLPHHAPPAPSGSANPQSPDQGQGDLSPALASMVRNSSSFDDKEKHFLPEGPVDPSTLPDTAKAAIAKALQIDPQDPRLEQDLAPGYIDQDMQSAIDSFRDGMTRLSPDSQLVSDSKAKLLFIDVVPSGIDSDSQITLAAKEKETVERMRGIFFRTLGKQKAQRNASGNNIDIDAAIQYAIEPSDPEIFENEQNHQGFAYLMLTDMSGSMTGNPFRQVCHATEMLKQSLHFPFVDGTLWGFRGGDPIDGRNEVNSEVWLYRYDKHCQGYLGKGKAYGKPFNFPVRCGGLTPMHAAIRVSARHLLTNVSPGMAKRLFLLTDGSPCGVRVNGKGLPHWVLQQYVAKEIQWARRKGIHVYTLVIDGGLDEQECKLMFGPKQFWRDVSSKDVENSIDRVLQHLVIQNFERFLKSRG